MRFLADMGITPRSVAHLRDLGVEAVHPHELGLDRLPNVEIVRKARREEHVILTSYNGPGRAPITIDPEHRFRGKPSTDSDGISSALAPTS